MFEVIVRETFSAAHFLRDYRGEDEPLHGHDFEVRVVCRADGLDEAGCAVDFVWLRERVRAILEPLDHACLNELDPFRERSPSAEAVALHLGRSLAPDLPDRARLSRVEVWETEGAGAAWIPDGEEEGVDT